MANIKSAKKRILVNETKAARNKAIKSKVKTCVKKVETAVANKDAAAAADALKVAIVEINKAGSKGVYHKNTCSRKISRLTKAVNGILGGMSMNKKNFLIGMGIGLVVGDAVGMITRPKKCASKNTLGKALRTMSDVADTISGYMGW